MVICLERGADLHMAQLMSLPLTVSCFSKIHIGFTILVLAHPGSPGQRAIKRVCVCVCVKLLKISYVHRSVGPIRRPLLQVCCCGPSGQEISTASAVVVGACGQCRDVSVRR